MAREQTANLGQSNLNSGITSGATTLDVDDASSFPSSAQFTIVIGNELLLVTAVSGNTFTVTRGSEGTTAAAHSSGDTVTLVLTQRSLRRYFRDWTNPFFDIPAAKPMQLLDASGNALTASSFTNVNFTNASKADTGDGSIVVTHDTQAASPDFAIIKKSAPSAPWVLTVGWIPNQLNDGGAFLSSGPVVRDSSTGEFYAVQFNIRDAGTWLFVTKRASPTSAPTTFLDNENWGAGFPIWFQIEDDNTDLIFRASGDGFNYVELGREARTTFLTPDEIGFLIENNGNASHKAMATIVAWDES